MSDPSSETPAPPEPERKPESTPAAPGPRHDFKSISGHMARGAAWMVGMRWSLRLIGLVNTLILARLLLPEDFGIIAMAMIVVNFLQVLSDLNVDLALVRHRDPTREHYDSAWTVQILAGLLVTAILYLLAAPLARYYGDPRVELVIQIVSLRAVILGCSNIGMVDIRRSMDFSKEFRFWLYQRLLLFGFGLGLVVALGDYMGLALASPLSAAIGVGLSYSMSSYRPRLSFTHVREMWSFSQWLIVYNAALFLGSRSDEFVVGGATDADTMGNYFIASDTSAMPTRELVMPIGRALIPTYAQIAHDRTEMRAAFLSVLGFLALICIPVGVGMAVVAEDFVLVVLGARWVKAVPYFGWLAIAGVMSALIIGMQPYFVVIGRGRSFALLYGAYAVALVPLLFLVAHRLDITWIPVARCLGTLGCLLVLFAEVVRIGSASIAEIAGVLWRPTIAATAMGLAIVALHPRMPDLRLLSLLHDVAVGVVLYVAVLFGTWLAAGRPDGPEKVALGQLRRWRAARNTG
ncbi:MAG: lipopolysaccharide biosynthesis protein [Alphaproteobacteria bacterium]